MLRYLPLVLLSACATTAAPVADTAPQDIPSGLAVQDSDLGAEASMGRVVAALEAAGPVQIMAQVDHRANAATRQLNLPATNVVIFGNPKLGTPMMLQDQRVALDLPQKILVYEEADGDVYVAYNSVDYLIARYGLKASPETDKISKALARFAASGGSSKTSTSTVMNEEGLVSIVSDADAATTLKRLKATITGNPKLSIMSEVDHAANASSVGMQLRFTSLVVFGNPAAGTPLMQQQRSAAIDLPQKMLVWEDAEGVVRVTYNDPNYLASRHGIAADTPQISAMAGALKAIAAKAAGSQM